MIMDILKFIAEKLSQYNFLTNIIPGSVLCILMKYFIGYDIIPNEPYQAGIIFYFVGMVNSRVGSLIIEPILKHVKWVVFSSYKDFLVAECKDSKVQVLNQENNVYRSYVSVFFILMIAFFYKHNLSIIQFVQNNETVFLILSLLLLFLCSYRKQTNYIRKRVEGLVNEEKD